MPLPPNASPTERDPPMTDPALALPLLPTPDPSAAPAAPPSRYFASTFAFLWNNSSQPSVSASEIALDRRSSSGGLPQ